MSSAPSRRPIGRVARPVHPPLDTDRLLPVIAAMRDRDESVPLDIDPFTSHKVRIRIALAYSEQSSLGYRGIRGMLKADPFDI